MFVVICLFLYSSFFFLFIFQCFSSVCFLLFFNVSFTLLFYQANHHSFLLFQFCVYKWERQSDNQGKRGFHYNSRDLREEGITEPKGSILYFEILYFTFKAEGKCTLLLKKNIAENFTEVGLKASPDFQGHQTTKNYNHFLSLMEVK